MKALVYHGREDVRCDTVPDPIIEDGRDAIIKVTACAICGSDFMIKGEDMSNIAFGDTLGTGKVYPGRVDGDGHPDTFSLYGCQPTFWR